jgi:hypothetical protein
MTLSRTLYLTSIRETAKKLVGDCSDYEIIFCAMRASVISNRIIYKIGASITSLESLDDYDVQALYDWMNRQ